MDYFALVRFLSDYINQYNDLLTFEYKKLDLINHNQIQELSNILSTEQALIMKINSMESKRLKLLEGSSCKNFKEIIESSPVSCKKRLEVQYNDLSSAVYKIKELNDMANIIISNRLKRVERRTAELDTYNESGTVKTSYAANMSISKNV